MLRELRQASGIRWSLVIGHGPTRTWKVFNVMDTYYGFGFGNKRNVSNAIRWIDIKYYFNLDPLLIYFHIKEHILLNIQCIHIVKLPYTVDLSHVMVFTEQCIVRKLVWIMNICLLNWSRGQRIKGIDCIFKQIKLDHHRSIVRIYWDIQRRGKDCNLHKYLPYFSKYLFFFAWSCRRRPRLHLQIYC